MSYFSDPRFVGPMLEDQYLEDYRSDKTEPFNDQPYRCGYCSGPAWSMHSGVYECQSCWDWRKLDSGAAYYWLRASLLTLCNIDMYDSMTFMPIRVGIEPGEFGQAMKTMKTIYEASFRMIEEHTSTDWAVEKCNEHLKALGMKLSIHPLTGERLPDKETSDA